MRFIERRIGESVTVDRVFHQKLVARSTSPDSALRLRANVGAAVSNVE